MWNDNVMTRNKSAIVAVLWFAIWLLVLTSLSSCGTAKMNSCWDSNGKTKNGIYK